MSLLLKNPLFNSINWTKCYSFNTHYNPNVNPKFSLLPISSNSPTFQSFNNNGFPSQRTLYLSHTRHLPSKAYDSSSFEFEEHEERPNILFNLDVFLSVLESLCLISSVLVSIGYFMNWVFFRQQNSGLVVLGNRVLVWLLAGSVVVGSVIRRRQWSRVCGPVPRKSSLGMESGNVIERVEKLEESMRSATTLIRMLSRQLEKLGIRFRVMRKTLRDPISETAALAQKNSEATRALSVQEDILEKELTEVQKVLLAMQDQQQKQLELILAIAKSGKLLETKQASPPPIPTPSAHEEVSSDRGLRQADEQPIGGLGGATSEKEKAIGS